MNISTPLQMLGDLSPEQFMRRHWQKKPLLIRNAIKNFKPLVDFCRLQELAAQGDVQSRLVTNDEEFNLEHGPFEQFPHHVENWTVLLQNMDVHVPAIRSLLDQFRFVPDARLDDVMISFAAMGGGVGPHFDSYDVFLLQAEGRRRWQISQQQDLSLIPDLPLKMLQNFEPTEEWVLEPGDMLYLPPFYAHDGVALDFGCQTYSIGFRAPKAGELASELLHRLADEISEGLDEDPAWAALYSDATQAATETPAKLPQALIDFAASSMQKALNDKDLVTLLAAEYLSEPSAEPKQTGRKFTAKTKRVSLSASIRVYYDDKHIYLNGDSLTASPSDLNLFKKLADQRWIDATELRAASADLMGEIKRLCAENWLLTE